MSPHSHNGSPEGVAIIGMAGRFPGANNIHAFWQNLVDGVESISHFEEAELELRSAQAGQPNYIKARGFLDGVEMFDAGFFNMTPREAEFTDPQHRVFLECAWEALESAGYDPNRYEGAIGVYAGCSLNTYLLSNLCSDRRVVEEMLAGHQFSTHPVLLGNDKDFFASRVAYKLNLRGPCLAIQTACSTSLVAVVEACQSLLACRCDMALAGGVSISFPQKRGYLYQEGAMASSDGRCRPFDVAAQGTVFGAGVGVVVLKRLAEALEARDQIIAVIKGAALNNDGSGKASYMAPSANGQAEVISLAHALAGVTADAISYVEAHGTGTPLGDPIEVAGLTQAFRASTDRRQFCALGAVKANIGHLEAAAGVTGLIKTALALEHRLIPPTLHFQRPNPDCDLESSPFYVVSTLQEWKNGSAPRRAGVSSFGIGGTNAHVVLEEAPASEPSGVSRPVQLLLLSARTKTALHAAADHLASHLKSHPQANLADVAYTLQVGRHAFEHRAILSCHDTADAAHTLESYDARRVFTGAPRGDNPPVVFMFPGQGAQHVNMARQLYETEPVFRNTVDPCCERLEPDLGLDLRTLLFPETAQLEAAAQRLKDTGITQPAMFVVEYALAQLWMSWGVQPAAMIGHSLGEYVAACLAGVFSLDDALTLIAARGRLMQALPGGTMLAVRLPELEVKPLLSETLALAAVNAARACVVSGPRDAIETLQRQLAERHADYVELQTSHAFHSAMMEPILAPFAELVQRAKRQPARIPFISNVTGTWITDAQASDPQYWATHLRQTIRFADGLNELFKVERVFLEVGPRQTLSGLARQHPARKATTPVIASLARPEDESPALEALLSALGQLWISGISPPWETFCSGETRHRVWLPTYPFERKRHWVEPAREPFPPSAEVAPRAVSTTHHGAGRAGSPESVRPTAAADAVAPGEDSRAPQPVSQTHSRLRTLVSTLSGLDPATLDSETTFTQLGFDSLFLTQASVAVERDFGVRVAFRQLLEDFTTLDSLAEHLDRNLPAQTPPSATHTGTGDARSDTAGPDAIVLAPLTESQREIWLASQMSGAASCVYNECRLLHLRGPLQAGVLRNALQGLVARHEALRTTFAPGGEVQRFHRTVKVDVPPTDWSHLETAERALRLDAVQVEEARQPFDLVVGPLIRARLIRLADDHHVFVVTVHHLVCDGYSFGILLHDLGELYSAECHRHPCSLPPPLQFGNYVKIQADRGQSPAHAADEQYWVDQFAAGTPVLELPTDQPRTSLWTFDGAREWRALPQTLGEQLKRLSAERGCTLFTTLFAAYLLLLRRLSRQKDIVVGVPLADRALAGGETLVGHCVNFLPLRGSIDDHQTFTAHLAAIQKRFLDADEHGRYAFGSLLQKLNPSRDPGRMPLVSATFNLERVAAEPAFFGVATELAGNAHSAASFDINFDATDAREGLQLNCRYNAGLFSAQTIQRWLAHYQTLLEGIVANPQRRVGDLPLLTEAEGRSILIEWNHTRADYPRDKCVHHLFEAEAARTPDAVAIEFEGARLTYGELNERANRLAQYLRKKGVGPETIVAVCLHRSLEMIVALLGILKAGGAYLPLDSSHPKERLALMLQEAQAPMLLTQEKMRAGLPGSSDAVAAHRESPFPNPAILCVDSRRKEIARESPSNPCSEATAESLAYISFTSGSTGKPKGVCVPHRAVVRLVKNTNYASLAASEVVLQLAPLAFDASTFEIWGPLLNGARLVIFPPHAPSLAELGEFIQKRGVTTLWLTAGLFHQMIEEQTHSLRGLRQLLAGGDVLSVPHVKRALEELPACRLINGYGPTENTTFTCCHPITKGAVAGRSIPIGRPIANTQAYVLDENLQPVPIGVPGELCAGGDGLARGYLNQPELTAGTFVPNPFSNDPRARLYRTGDLARWLPDGCIEFLGRRDAQVKIRGNRVELGEIETVLSRHPAVRECVVMARQHSSGDKRLTAYFVGTDSARPAFGELSEHLRRALPDYMIPAGFVRLESLPLTASGKVDRKALPEPGETESESRQRTVPFNDDFEKHLAEIWQDVLGRSRVGASDDFFELGGHSLLALRLIARMETAFGKRIPVASVFHARTVAQMANLLREKSQPPNATSIVEIQPQGSRPPLMLVHGAGGGMFWGYTALAQHLGTDQPVYAFKSRCLDGQEESVTIEEMAADYVADLRTFQPRGPYYLGGYCFGGNVAYEMARQLHAQGERVALLALLNSIPPNSPYDHAVPSPVWLARFLWNLFHLSGCFLRRPRPERRLFIGWYARAFSRKFARLFTRRPPSEVSVDELVDLAGYPPEQRHLWRTDIRALFRHRTKPYAGRVTLLRSRGHPFWCSFDYAYGWRDFAAGGAAIHLVPGAHEQILAEPHVSVLAEQLRGELARAQNDEPATQTRPSPGVGPPDAAKVPAAAVMASPTIEPPAGLVRKPDPARPLQIASSIVEIQPNGSKLPLFLVHGIGGGMLWGYANLSRFLGPDQPVYAFNSRGLNGQEEFGTIEEMAAQYVAELRAFQPAGSYRLGGYCFGGNVAYEMARLLEAQGQPVSLLALFNCPPPNSGYYRVRLTPGFCVNFLKNFTNRAGHVLRLKPEPRRQLVLWRARVLKHKCLSLFNRFRGVTPELDVDDWVDLTTQPADRRELWAAHLRAYAGYQPKPYGGQVALFRTRGHPLVCSFDDACGWREFVAGGVTVHVVPGEHESILDLPHVKLLAKTLEPYLQPTRETPGTKPDRPAATTPALSPGEEHPSPAEWNHTQAGYPREKCVHHLFEEQVERTPHAVAAVFQEQSLTYRQLDDRAAALAQQLQDLNVGPDVPVGICVERSLDMVIGVLAILKAGGAYVPLDPAYPQERLRLMIDNTRATVLLTQRSLCQRLQPPVADGRLLCLDATGATPVPHSGSARPAALRPSGPTDLAYVIHTSGSTGTPKGVAMPHRPLVNLTAWQVRNSKLPPGARTLQFASLSFDVSFQEMFSTWCAGGTLVLVTENLRRDPGALLRFIRDNKIERLFMPFVALQQLAEAFKPEATGVWSLREIITAGEQLQTTPALVRMFERLTDCTLHNQYGPSESHVVTAFTLSGPPGRWPALPPIGRPIANTRIYLLDERRQRVPVGVPGELYIGGDCLARGYLHRPDLTADRFCPDPFSDDGEARLYQTGDLARHRPDGNIDFLGRTDQQVKIRGFRIELGEIDATLRQHPKVRDAVVMARADQPGPKRLVAYYLSQPGQPRADEELRLFLKERLPDYMVPTAFVALEVFPLTPSGKVARNRLPTPDHARHGSPENLALPGTPTERALASIWCDLLGLSQIGIHENFFELGGDSLLAVQAIARMSQSFGVELPVSGLFEAPTIALTAKALPAPSWEKECHETDRQPAALAN